MEKEAEEALAEAVWSRHQERIEEALEAEAVDSDQAMAWIADMWEDYLRVRTTGAEGKPGKKGRSKEPKLRVTSLAAGLAGFGDDTVAEDLRLKRMRKMFARAADWAAKLRRCPVVPGAEAVEEEPVEPEAEPSVAEGPEQEEAWEG